LQGFKNEFELTCAAQDGNGRAWLALWSQYKAMLMSRLVKVKGLTRSELESEALDLFAYELKKFDRNKVSSENAFSLHSWLYLHVKNRVGKLIRKRKKDVHLYYENVSAADLNPEDGYYPLYEEVDQDYNPLQDQILGSDTEIYYAFSPEKLAVESLKDSDSSRVKIFYSRLSPFQRDILANRREGLTLLEVAKKFGCSLTTVKYHVKKAKEYADDVFQVCYA
jgi:RNA polymerase sigma factor (sigma-70 family)